MSYWIWFKSRVEASSLYRVGIIDLDCTVRKKCGRQGRTSRERPVCKYLCFICGNPPEKIWICLINACMLHRWAELHLLVTLSKFVHTCDPERIRCQLNHWKRNDAHSPWADLFPTVGYRIVYLAVVCVGISTPKNTNVNSYYIILPLSKRLILGLNKP